MKWTNEKPTVPGWYWYRPTEDKKSQVVYVDNIRYIEIIGELYAWFNMTLYDFSSISGMDGEFAGPIPVPDEEAS